MAFEHSFGIEEEFFLVDAATGALGTPALDQLMSDARVRLGDVVTSELLQSQIEIASPILHRHAEAREVMSRTRRSLSEVVAGHGLQIVAASTHPLGVWQEQLVTEKRRYDKLMADFRIVSQRNLVCGLHIHVAIPETVDRVDMMNRAMPWLPLFLALSTSSPFWNHRVTGLLSVRWCPHDLVSCRFIVSVARCALSRCELQRASSEARSSCNGLLEWRRWERHRGCELPEDPHLSPAQDARLDAAASRRSASAPRASVSQPLANPLCRVRRRWREPSQALRRHERRASARATPMH